MVPRWENHFDQRTAWSLIYFLNYAYLDIWPSVLYFCSPSNTSALKKTRPIIKIRIQSFVFFNTYRLLHTSMLLCHRRKNQRVHQKVANSQRDDQFCCRLFPQFAFPESNNSAQITNCANNAKRWKHNCHEIGYSSWYCNSIHSLYTKAEFR